MYDRAHPDRSANGRSLSFFAHTAGRLRMAASGRGRSVADRRVSVSEGRKRAFPGDALRPASRILPNVLTYARVAAV